MRDFRDAVPHVRGLKTPGHRPRNSCPLDGAWNREAPSPDGHWHPDEGACGFQVSRQTPARRFIASLFVTHKSNHRPEGVSFPQWPGRRAACWPGPWHACCAALLGLASQTLTVGFIPCLQDLAATR